jgi:hypothetical protein
VLRAVQRSLSLGRQPHHEVDAVSNHYERLGYVVLNSKLAYGL